MCILFQLTAIELKQHRPKQGKVKQVFSKLNSLFQLTAIELKQPRPKQGKVKQVFSKLNSLF